MAEHSRSLLFRKRNVLGAALIAGIGVGVWLAPWLSFTGWFSSGGKNIGSGTTDAKNKSSNGKSEETSDPVTLATTESEGELPVAVSATVKVLIDDREFLLRQPDEDVPMTLGNLIQLIKQAPGDDHGVRVRIYQKASARASAEEQLKQALVDANIPDRAILWVPTPVSDHETRRSGPPKNK